MQKSLTLMETENRMLRECLRSNGVDVPGTTASPHSVPERLDGDVKTAELLLHDIRSLHSTTVSRKSDSDKEVKFSGVYALIKSEVHSLLKAARESVSSSSSTLSEDSGDSGAGGGPVLVAAVGTPEGSVSCPL